MDYSRKLKNLEDLELAIDLCISTNELAELYTLNQELAKDVTKLFTKKKQTL